MYKTVACEYIGRHKVELNKYGGPYINAKGEQLFELSLNPGDTLMLPEAEVKGYTILRDLTAQTDPVHLGVGKVVLPQHQGKSDDELMAIGYQFHQGRPDFREIVPSINKKRKEGTE
jgi:hypothetical protein